MYYINIEMEPELRKKLIGTYCSCYNISYNEIAMFVKNSPHIKTLEELNNYFVCCKKCKICCPDIQNIIDFYRNPK
jgi:NAD(P)H-nitrite reductase large subunit